MWVKWAVINKGKRRRFYEGHVLTENILCELLAPLGARCLVTVRREEQ